MPIHLQFAPSADLLLEHVLSSLRMVWSDPFEPPTLMVPNPALGRWLRLRLADYPEVGFKSVLSLETTTLERYLWDMLQPEPDMARLDANTFAQVLDSLLSTATCAEAVFAPVRQYLVGADHEVDPLRRIQLASRLARLFQEYEFNRPSVGNHEATGWRLAGIDASWLGNQEFFANGIANEAWQKALYRMAQEFLCKPIAGKRLISLPHLHRMRREQGLADGSPWRVPPGSVLMFQLAKISHFHRNILIEISQMPGVDLRVFLTNPCAEFWEDVDTWRSRTPHRVWDHKSTDAAIASRSPEDYQKSELNEVAPQPSEHPLLQLWGHTGKENIYLWCPASQWNFEYHSPARADLETPPESLLEAVQLSLLRRQSSLEPRADGSLWCGDASLKILEAPDRTREVEELRSQILTLVSSGKVSQLEEIVVYMTDPAAYLAPIQRVFGAYLPWDPRNIPFAVLGVPGSDSLFAQGMQAMLALVAGSFDRAQVFTVLRNPIVQATQGFSAEDVSIWEHWASELGIFRGFDRSHRERMGDATTYASDAHTFGLGLARLLVGNLASGAVELGYGSPLPVYRDYESSDAPLLACFCIIVDKLYQDTLAIDVQTGLATTIQKLTDLTEIWFREFPVHLGAQRAGEARIKREFLDALQAIALQETLCARTDLEKEELLGLVKACLPEELPTSSKAWTGGVTFAPLRQGMVLPHTAIFVLGLDAAAFPGMNRATPFDLIAQERILGDSDPVRENRFSFLELIHAARKILVLSYRARNMQKEELLQSSSVVLELDAWLTSQGVSEFRTVIPWISSETLHDVWNEEPVKLREFQGAPRYALRYKPASTSVPVVPNNQAPVRISLFSLRTFFANPLEYHLRHVLNLVDEDDAQTLLASEEPLQTDSRALAVLQKAIWVDVLRLMFPANTPLQEITLEQLQLDAEIATRKHYNTQSLIGHTPEAQFAAMEIEALCLWTNSIVLATHALYDDFHDHRIVVDTDFSLGIEKTESSLLVDMIDHSKVEIIARHGVVLVPRGGLGRVGIMAFSNLSEAKAKDSPDLWLAGVLEQMHVNNALDVVLVLLNRRDCVADLCALQPWNTLKVAWSNMKEWLQHLLEDVLYRGCAEHLPLSVVQKITKSKNKETRIQWERLTVQALEEELEADRSSYRSFLGAFKLVEAKVPQQEDELVRLAQQRFAPLLEGFVHG